MPGGEEEERGEENPPEERKKAHVFLSRLRLVFRRTGDRQGAKQANETRDLQKISVPSRLSTVFLNEPKSETEWGLERERERVRHRRVSSVTVKI